MNFFYNFVFSMSGYLTPVALYFLIRKLWDSEPLRQRPYMMRVACVLWACLGIVAICDAATWKIAYERSYVDGKPVVEMIKSFYPRDHWVAPPVFLFYATLGFGTLRFAEFKFKDNKIYYGIALWLCIVLAIGGMTIYS